MPEHCVGYSCSNRRTIESRARGITFHKFPKDNDVRKKWEVALRREGFTASASSVLCSQHFKQDDFDRTGQIVRLKDGVIPSVFSFPVHLQRLETGRTTSTSRRAKESLSMASQDYQEMATSHQQPQPNDDHGYALPASPTALKTRLNEALARVESLEQEKKNAMAREKRAKTTVNSLLGDLKKNNLINEELKEKLEFYSDLQLDLMAKQGHEYTKEYREFALTLHLHGPKAYRYLREIQHFPLPHPHTLQRWLRSVDAKPGLNMMMLDMLERKCQGDQAKYGHVTLMLDAMSIRKQVQYNPHTQSMSGFVDMGDGSNETDVATEALVFMVVGLQGHWKAPIAYFLTKSLSPETQRVLLSHALEELHARGIRVVCVTMDGHASNVSMCNQLGCDLKGDPREPLQTSFSHPVTGEKVFVMMDACHMLKLARNMLQAYSPIATTTGQINWRYINHLNDVQKKDGLHAANKITDKHVYFENHKMRVSLAAQTLSRSVSVALRTMRDLGYSQFKDCEATAEFIEIIDRLFDVMNGRNPRAKGFKAPLGALNWMERKAFLSRAREYFLTLVTKEGTPLHRSKRYLSVIGFVINIDTLMRMIPELLQVQRYVLTYRFSQDHLELLFNSIRASGGWNNNPSARQFQAIFRRLMVRCGVSPGETGNVAAQDSTVSLSAVEMSSAETAEEHPSPFTNISALVCDHSYLPTRFGGLVENALVYIAGFVVRQVLRKLSCDVCRVSLVSDAVPSSFDKSYHLLTLKNNGGLVIPSQGTVKVLRAAERVIRQSSTNQAPKVSTVTHIVREEIGTEDVFLLGEHIEDTQFGIDNHHFDLLSLVVSVFLKIRLHHIAKLTSLELQKGSMRKKLCKTVLFQGF